MARPIKDGFPYFPLDTDFLDDEKIILLRSEFGTKGVYIYIYLICKIYREKGYFLNWDKNSCFIVSVGAGCGCTPENISEVVAGCVRCSLFDKRVFNVFGVLTSAGIQRRYLRMCNSRNEIRIIEEYWLLDVNDKKEVPPGILNKVTFKKVFYTENPVKSKENPVKSKENSQSKVKESKVKNIKEKHTKEKSKTASGFNVSVPEPIMQTFSEFEKMRKLIKHPLTDYAAKRILSKLQQLAPDDYDKQNEILNQSIDNSWIGVFPLKDEKNGGGENGRRQDYKSFKPSRT